MQQHRGIILRKFTPHKVALLDQDRGRIDLLFFGQSYSPGALIHYQLKGNQEPLRADSIIFEQFPPIASYADLLFFHHVLELVYFFIPLHSSTTGIFELLHRLYDWLPTYYVKRNKKFFLYKLLLAIGFYPEWHGKFAREKQLLALSIDSINDESIDLEDELFLDKWLLACIKQHPRFDQFKTVHFFTQE